jgi:hypothetical protein
MTRPFLALSLLFLSGASYADIVSERPVSTLVTWSDCNNVFATILDRSGVAGTATFVTPSDSHGTGGVSAAWNGREWLVAWDIELQGAGGLYYEMKAARLSASLTVLDPRPISVGAGFGPIAASDGNDFLVVSAAIAQRISADGALLDTHLCERQPSTLLKFTSDEPAAVAMRWGLFTDSVEKAAESSVQNSKERAKCGLLSALHNSVGGFR